MLGRLKDYGLESETYDNRIVQVANDVCKQLGYESKTAQVLWMDWETRIGRMNSDECRFVQGTILLPKRMRGVLDPEEWRPVMASSLIYRKRFRQYQPWRLGLAILLAPTLAIFGGAILAKLFGPERLPILWLVYLVLVVLPISANLVTQARKKLRLEADSEAARSMGSAAFLTVLRKIDELRLEDVETTKTRRMLRHFSSKPDIAERIANISLLDYQPDD